MAIVPLFGRGEGYRSRTISQQRRVNLYLEYEADPDKSDVMMLGTPGLTLWTNLGASPARGAWNYNNNAYVVNGTTLYQINNAGVYTALGTLATSTGRVSMSDNGVQLIIVDGTAGYIYTFLTGVFSTITDVDFPNGATTVTFLDQFFIVNKPGTSGQFAWSQPLDGTSWDALDFATAESNPDPLLAVTVKYGILYLWGSVTLEFWAASGDTAIFRRVGGSGVDWGIPSPWSIANFGDGEIALLKNRMGQFQVAVVQGMQVIPVSSPDITHDMNAQTSIQGATGYSYMMDNHLFYQVNFTNKSYLFNWQMQDVGTGSFSLQSCSWGEVSSNGGRHLGEIRFELLSKPYICDYSNGNIYIPSLQTYQDNGQPIIRTWESKHVFHDLERITVDMLQIEFEPGVGLITGQGSNPQAMLQISRNGGADFGNEHWRSIGVIGNYIARLIWRQLGRARDFVFRVSISDPVKIAVVNIALKVR